MRLLLGAAAVLACASGCGSVCGQVNLNGVDKNAELERYRAADGSMQFSELCGADEGSFALLHEELKVVTFTLDANVPSFDFGDDLALARIVLPAASVGFWSAHLKAGEVLTGPQLAGSGLHKQNEPATYQVYPLTGGSVKVLSGPRNQKTEFGSSSEEWQLEWSLEYGGKTQKWTGTDWVILSAATKGSRPAHVPTAPKP